MYGSLGIYITIPFKCLKDTLIKDKGRVTIVSFVFHLYKSLYNYWKITCHFVCLGMYPNDLSFIGLGELMVKVIGQAK